MRLVTREQALRVDLYSQKRFGLAAEDLMERAGERMAGVLLNSLGGRADHAIIVAGTGNNGGDALVIARHLHEKRIPVSIYLPTQTALSALAETQLEKLKTSGGGPLRIQNYADLPSAEGSLVIDGIFGVGLDRVIEGEFADAVRWINGFKGTVVSVDVPSGLNCDTGGIFGVAVKAARTLTVVPPKIGCYLRQGPSLCGKIETIDVGFPAAALATFAKDYYLMEASHAKKWWPCRDSSSNKARFGHAYVVAGSRGKWGAAVLCLRAVFRAGAGYVVHSSMEPGRVLDEVPEAMEVPWRELASQLSGKKDAAVAIGPGAGFSKNLVEMILELRKGRHPAVLDGDALTLLARTELRLPRGWILTPHSGELARLIRRSSEEVESDPLSAALYAWRKYGCTVVLKGLYTVVVSGYSGRAVVVPRGNVALAKAGTGDVLTGLITGLLAQGLHPVKAALLGVWVHGSAAEEWVSERSNAALSASDLVDWLPRAMKPLDRV